MSDHNQRNLKVKMVSNWGNLAATAKRNGTPSVGHFIVRCMLAGVHIPPTAMKEVYRAWRDSE